VLGQPFGGAVARPVVDYDDAEVAERLRRE
jgi:hypothetical protein